MSRLSDTTFLNPFFLAVKMRYITSMDIKIFTIDVAGQCGQSGISLREIHKTEMSFNTSQCSGQRDMMVQQCNIIL